MATMTLSLSFSFVAFSEAKIRGREKPFLFADNMRSVVTNACLRTWACLCDVPQVGSKLLRKYGIPLLLATVGEIWADVFGGLLTSKRDTLR